MKSDVWRQLLALESVDLVSNWHRQISGRTLSLRRAHEITASAKQAREYFRNASSADDTVRPLLTFYGVASLARSALLVLKRDSGEESLTQGHGLEASGWKNTLSGDHSEALKNLGNLKVNTREGLFNDFVNGTGNRMCLHVNSSAVDGRLGYPVTPLGSSFTLEDLLVRFPDIARELAQAGVDSLTTSVNRFEIANNMMKIDVARPNFESFSTAYADSGCLVEWHSAAIATIKYPWVGNDSFQPQFAHAYINRVFSIPHLHIAKPFAGDLRLSQLAMTYLLGYYLGMLTRYFPTHWIALHRGTRGDALWPAIHAAQNYVELAFPELIIELLLDTVQQKRGRSEGESSQNSIEAADTLSENRNATTSNIDKDALDQEL